jgi:MFS family permease
MLRIKHPYIILLLLTVAYTLSFMDRYVMNLFLNKVKTDFQLSETQAGLLAGAGFAVLYALMALPMGIVADRSSRTKLAALGVAVWSIMTMGCGLAKNFALLFVGRIGVGVGEAALTPAAYPVIKSLFRSEKLSTALGVYSSGIYIGSGLAYWLGGKALTWIQNENYLSAFGFVSFDWQLVFILFGLPGLLVAALLYFIYEPQQETSKTTNSQWTELVAFLKTNNYFFLKFCFASAAFNVAVYAAGVWLPAYLQRLHHMTIAESGQLLGMTMLFVAPIGAIAGGFAADYFSVKRGLSGRIQSLLFFLVAIAACFGSLSFTFTGTLLYAPLIGLSLLMGAPVAITAAAVQEMAPENLRSTAPAFLLMMQNLIGMSLGPLAVALLTQYVFHNNQQIGEAIAIVGVVFCSVAFILFYAIRKAVYEQR